MTNNPFQNLINGEKGLEKFPFGLNRAQARWVGVIVLLIAIGVSFLWSDNLYRRQVTPQAENQLEGGGTVLSDKDNRSKTTIETDMEAKLREILSEIDGVGEVEVSVFLYEGPEYQYATNNTQNQRKTEEHGDGKTDRTVTEDSRETQLVLAQSQGQAGQQPVIVKEVKPKVRGVLIVAPGARTASVRAQLIQAAVTLLNVQPHQVMVAARKPEGKEVEP